MFTVIMESPHEVGDRLRWARERAGLSQQQLADAAGVSFQAISAWENGRNRTIKSEYLPGLVRALNVDVLWLLTGEGVPDPGKNDDATVLIADLPPEQQALVLGLIRSLKRQ